MGKRSMTSRICGCAFTVGLLGALGYGLWYWLGKPTSSEDLEDLRDKFGDFSDILGNLTDFVEGFNSDPFVGNNDTNQWEGDGKNENGLNLVLQNALDDTWQQEYAEAVQDWEAGLDGLDPLALSTENVEVDRVCTHVDGLMKVCNGNYGETGWLGINELRLIRNNVILSSVAKMNEYYLGNADFAERRYTMCHELGHGFGLPHTDENFDNRDLGNCMDYTRNPEANISPDTGNFARLIGLYGNHNNRLRRHRSLEKTAIIITNATASDEQYETAMEEFRAWTMQHRRGSAVPNWTRRLSDAEGGDLFERRLDGDMTLQVHVLYQRQR